MARGRESERESGRARDRLKEMSKKDEETGTHSFSMCVWKSQLVHANVGQRQNAREIEANIFMNNMPHRMSNNFHNILFCCCWNITVNCFSRFFFIIITIHTLCMVYLTNTLDFCCCCCCYCCTLMVLWLLLCRHNVDYGSGNNRIRYCQRKWLCIDSFVPSFLGEIVVCVRYDGRAKKTIWGWDA